MSNERYERSALKLSYPATLLITALFLLAASRCFGPCDGRTVPEAYAPFITLPPEQASARLAALPVAQQVDIYVYLTTQIHPPISYADVLASRGNEVAPLLVARLRQARRDNESMRLITSSVSWRERRPTISETHRRGSKWSRPSTA